MNWRRLLGTDKPNVGALAREGDVEGLVEAARYRDVVRRVDGRLSDAGASVREQAVLALQDCAGDRAGDTLYRALRDPADRVRCSAVVALYERDDASALAQAAAYLRDEDGEALALSFRALLELEQPGSTLMLATAILRREDDRPVGEIDGSFLRALLEAEGPEAADEVVDMLISALASDREAVADRAEDLLELFAPESVDALTADLGGRGAAPHRSASVLGRIKDARALEPLVAALGHPDPMVRMESCVALGELRDPAATEPLLRATRDSEHVVRAGAGAALDRIGTAAIAVSVAALLRPLLQAAPGETLRALEEDSSFLLKAGGPTAPNGVGPTLLRRLARFVDRVEDARAGARGRDGRTHDGGRRAIPMTRNGHGRAVSTHKGDGRAISFPRQANAGNGAPTKGKTPFPWPPSGGKSSRSATLE